MQSYTDTAHISPPEAPIPALRSFALLKGLTLLMTETNSGTSCAIVVALGRAGAGGSFLRPAT